MESKEVKREVRKAAAGDEAAAAHLFDHFYPRVYRYAVAKLGRSVDAEDVAAETFARALKGFDRFRWRGAGFEAWLFRIASNLVVDRIRLSSREVVVTDVLDPGGARDPISPEEAFLRAEADEGVRGFLALLPPDQREVLVLRFAAGLDTNEVAAVMKRNANAVRQLQYRALDKLRQAMAEEGSPQGGPPTERRDPKGSGRVPGSRP